MGTSTLRIQKGRCCSFPFRRLFGGRGRLIKLAGQIVQFEVVERDAMMIL
jgi:hypothetical protein